MQFKIRNATPDDQSEIIVMCVEHAAFEKANCQVHRRSKNLVEMLFNDQPAIHCRVVEKDTMLFGYTTYMKQYSTWAAESYLYLDCLFLRPQARGQGVGRKMMSLLQEEAIRLGCGHLQWQTPNFNQSAIQFYEKLGATGKSRIRFEWPGATDAN